MASEFESLLDEFRRALAAERVAMNLVDGALERLLRATSARAVGFWKRIDAELTLVGFRAVADMPAEVQAGFVEATRAVPLNQTGFGIVQAVVTNRPALATLDPETCGLPGSLSWVAKFGARSSVAVPIRRDGAVVGALALATANDLVPDDAVWRLLEQLADEIGEVLR